MVSSVYYELSLGLYPVFPLHLVVLLRHFFSSCKHRTPIYRQLVLWQLEFHYLIYSPNCNSSHFNSDISLSFTYIIISATISTNTFKLGQIKPCRWPFSA